MPPRYSVFDAAFAALYSMLYCRLGLLMLNTGCTHYRFFSFMEVISLEACHIFSLASAASVSIDRFLWRFSGDSRSISRPLL